MVAKETLTESVISVFQAVLEFVLFDGCFVKLIKLILIQTTASIVADTTLGRKDAKENKSPVKQWY